MPPLAGHIEERVRSSMEGAESKARERIKIHSDKLACQMDSDFMCGAAKGACPLWPATSKNACVLRWRVLPDINCFERKMEGRLS